MSKDRHRPNLDKRLSRITRTSEPMDRRALIDQRLNEYDLIDVNGIIKDCLADQTQPVIDDDPIREVTREVGISVDVLEVFAEEQHRGSVTSYALLDNEFSSTSPNAPRSILTDDYSEESRP